jgi:hypothetical protein
MKDEATQDEVTKLEQALEDERERVYAVESECERLKQDLDVLTEEHSFLVAQEIELKRVNTEQKEQV